MDWSKSALANIFSYQPNVKPPSGRVSVRLSLKLKMIRTAMGR